MARALSLILVLLAAAPALAQSTRYPPEPKDSERDADAHSAVWESALDPERKPYEDLLVAAHHDLEDHSREAAKGAITKLDDAIRRIPADPRAYAQRGWAYLVLRDFAKCAADLAVADDRAPPAGTAAQLDRDALLLELGICQGRSGHYADAERTLARAVATAPHGEQWMRLGEVRIALGKLDEAIDALGAAVDANEGSLAMIQWLLALAYDRARRPADAAEHALMAARADPSFSTVTNATYPLLGAGETDYLLGLAHAAAVSSIGSAPTPEYALLYFRHFLKLAPDSPWRRRAEEHVRELAAVDEPQTIRRDNIGGATLDLSAMQPLVKKAMPALRACLAKLPGTVFLVAVVRDGPRSADAARDRPRYVMPPNSVTADPSLELDADPKPDDDAAKHCLEPIVDHLALPTPKERDTWYKLWFLVGPP